MYYLQMFMVLSQVNCWDRIWYYMKWFLSYQIFCYGNIACHVKLFCYDSIARHLKLYFCDSIAGHLKLFFCDSIAGHVKILVSYDLRYMLVWIACFLLIYLTIFFSTAKPIRPGQHQGSSPATGTSHGIRGGGGGMAVNGPQN